MPPAAAPPATFLRPNAAERAKLVSQHEEKAREKKKAAKEKAEERRLKRKADAARDAEIAEQVARDAIPAEERERDDAINAYLDGRVFYGQSNFEDRELVKELCGERSQRVFDGGRKLWGTREPEFLRRLIRSHRWQPVGLAAEWSEALLAAADERAAARSAKAESASAKKAEATAPEAPEAMTAEEREVEEMAARRRAMHQQGTAEEERRCQALGIKAHVIDASQSWPDLGPTSGLSAELRVLRWVDVEGRAALAPYEFAAEGGDAAFLARVEAAARTRAVAAMNARAGPA